MSEPRAQRQVAPTHLPRSGASRGTRRCRDSAPDDAFIVFAHAVLAARSRGAGREQAAGRAARRRPTRSTSCASPRGGCASRCGSSAACCRARTPRASAPSCVGSRARSATFATSTSTRENFKAYVQALPPEQRGGLSGYEMYLRRERAEARQRAAAAVASPRAAALLADLERFVAAGPSAGALRRWGSLTVRRCHAPEHSPQRRPRPAPRQRAHDTRAAGASSTSCASRRSACATSSSSSQRSIRR